MTHLEIQYTAENKNLHVVGETETILTKDNMIKRKWQGDPYCYFCGSPGTLDHLMFECPIAKVVRGILAGCFNQISRPSSYEQIWV